MYTVYVLKSLKNGKKYVGMTSKNLSQRLDWHRWGLTSWTRQNGPFKLIYSEQLDTKGKALAREKYLKSGQGRRTVEHMIKSSSVCAIKHGASATICGGG